MPTDRLNSTLHPFFMFFCSYPRISSSRWRRPFPWPSVWPFLRYLSSARITFPSASEDCNNFYEDYNENAFVFESTFREPFLLQFTHLNYNCKKRRMSALFHSKRHQNGTWISRRLPIEMALFEELLRTENTKGVQFLERFGGQEEVMVS